MVVSSQMEDWLADWDLTFQNPRSKQPVLQPVWKKQKQMQGLQ